MFRQNFAQTIIHAFAHTQNDLGTPRERYQVNFCKESKP